MVIRPPGSGASTPEMTLISVDLPDPFSPTRQCTSPTSRVRSTSRSACTPPKRFDMPDISRKVTKGSPAMESCSLEWSRIPDRKGRECSATRRLNRSGLEPSGNQSVDGFLVDAHDLVHLDLLSCNVDGRLAKAGYIDAIRDGLASGREFGHRDHRVTRIGGIPQKSFADRIIRDKRLRLAWQHGADNGDLLAKTLLTHSISSPDWSIRTEAENTTQVGIGLDHVERRALAGVDLVGPWEAVSAELHFRKILLLVGNRGIGPFVVKRRRKSPDIDYIITFAAHVLGETFHLHLAEANGVDQFHIPVTAFLFRTLMRNDLDSGGLGTLQHGLADFYIKRHQADHVDLLGNQILKELYLLCRIDVRRAHHGGINAEILRTLLDSLFKCVEPRNSRDLHDRDHFLLGLRKGKARNTGTGQRGRAADQLERLASVHCSLPGNYLGFRPLDPTVAGWGRRPCSCWRQKVIACPTAGP